MRLASTAISKLMRTRCALRKTFRGGRVSKPCKGREHLFGGQLLFIVGARHLEQKHYHVFVESVLFLFAQTGRTVIPIKVHT